MKKEPRNAYLTPKAREALKAILQREATKQGFIKQAIVLEEILVKEAAKR
jgi:hypothetical protein